MDGHSLYCGAESRYIDLVSEIGELGKEIIKSTDYGKRAFGTSKSFEDEMGDCLFSLLALCCEADIDAASALDRALRKYEKRFSASGSISSGE